MDIDWLAANGMAGRNAWKFELRALWLGCSGLNRSSVLCDNGELRNRPSTAQPDASATEPR